MKFWKYSRVAVALIGAAVLGLTITCCGVYTSGYMYVTGAQYNQIGAYKIDHDFGYLTPVTGSPFANVGGTPTQEVVIPGGRFLAVVNQGTPGAVGGGNVSIYTIGGAGVIAFQHSYSTSGINPVSVALAPAGNYLYVLDQLAPDGSGKGDITVFSIEPSTGKLTLITNQNTFNTNGTQLPYFEVNYNPVQIVTHGSYVYVLDTAYNASLVTPPAGCGSAPTGSPCATPDIFLYQINTTNGQLTLTQNAPLTLDTLPGAASTIAVSASGGYIYVADNDLGQSSGRILPFTVNSSTGVLQSLVGGPINNFGAVTYPDVILTNSNTQFLYVADAGPNSVFQQDSSISGYSISTANGQLQPLPVATGNPFPTGSGPVWMVIDPTNQYLYTADHNSNTITGRVMGATSGQLSNLFKGTTFSTVGQPTFVVVTGRTY